MSDSDLLSETRLREALGARPFRFFAQVGSTNDVARQWALANAPTRSVVVAEEQVAGRGRFGRVWTAPAGSSLLMSVILRPRVTPARLSRMTMVGAVSLAEVLEDLAPWLIGLKWPNDVQVKGRKVAGILAETALQPDSMATPIAVMLDKLLRRIDYWSVRGEESGLLEAWRGRLTTIGQRVAARAAGAQVNEG